MVFPNQRSLDRPLPDRIENLRSNERAREEMEKTTGIQTDTRKECLSDGRRGTKPPLEVKSGFVPLVVLPYFFFRIGIPVLSVSMT